ncbi:hypothetical protein FA95DRAFT_781231 [Auriscalpium vulgare]|uniref:Uncharacterized protein n=1 Tax=Auriscalpium vulgare TaxID=40419 RepID=A0ACB8RAC8_9AGAM|nr:hypothetical protein FA95DRAFT_781231 [Auriscalpium vulgare]
MYSPHQYFENQTPAQVYAPQSFSAAPPPDLLGDGYISNSFYPEVAHAIFSTILQVNANSLKPSWDVHGWPGAAFISRPTVVGAKPLVATNGKHRWCLDHYYDRSLGSVVSQKIPHPDPWRPLQLPIFFVHESGRVGVPASDATMRRIESLRGRDDPAPVGRTAYGSIKICINWPGVTDYSTHIRVDTGRAEERIDIALFLKRIAFAIASFLECHGSEVQATIGGERLSLHEITVIGLVNAGLDKWFPILRLSRFVFSWLDFSLTG